MSKQVIGYIFISYNFEVLGFEAVLINKYKLIETVERYLHF